MVFIECSKDYFILAKNSKLYIFNLKNFTKFELELPELNLNNVKDSKAFVKNNLIPTNSLSNNDNPVCGQFSNDGNLFVVSDIYKRLIVWKINSDNLNDENNILWELFKILNSEKKAVQLQFLNNNSLLVGDKSCDVYRYDLETGDSNLLFGHISMLLDMKICPKEKFIITCDRDEKIRVTNYPSTYNIQSFCLGHSEFVSCCTFIDNEHIISGSGDSTIKLWNIINGKELFSLNLKEYLKNESDLLVNKINKDKINDNLNELNDKNLTENNSTTSIIKQNEIRLAIKKIFFIQSKVVITFYDFTYIVTINLDEQKLDQIIKLESKILDGLILNNQLYLLTLNNGMKCYELNNENQLTKIEENKLLTLINDNKELLKFNENENSNYQLLYKQFNENFNEEIDELDETLKRKKK